MARPRKKVSNERLRAIEERKSRRLNLFIFILVAAVLAEGAYMFLQSSYLDVRGIEVSGYGKTTKERVVRLSGITRKTGFFGVDTDEIARRITAEPWIEKADVAKTWRLKIRIAVRERTPVAVMLVGQDFCLIDRSGMVITTARKNEFGPLPLLTDTPIRAAPRSGSIVKDKSVSNALDCLKGLDKRIIDEADRFSAPSIDGLTINLKSGLVILYGKAELTDQKNYAIDVILNEARKEGREWKYIDVRVPSNPAAMPAA